MCVYISPTVNLGIGLFARFLAVRFLVYLYIYTYIYIHVYTDDYMYVYINVCIYSSKDKLWSNTPPFFCLFRKMPSLLGTACRRDPAFNDAVLKARRAHLSQMSPTSFICHVLMKSVLCALVTRVG